jgi:hypothetical protein
LNRRRRRMRPCWKSRLQSTPRFSGAGGNRTHSRLLARHPRAPADMLPHYRVTKGRVALPRLAARGPEPRVSARSTTWPGGQAFLPVRSVARKGVEPFLPARGAGGISGRRTGRLLRLQAPRMGIEPICTWSTLRPRHQSRHEARTVAQVGVEPTACPGLGRVGLPVAY